MHALLLALASKHPFTLDNKPERAANEQTVVVLQLLPAAPAVAELERATHNPRTRSAPALPVAVLPESPQQVPHEPLRALVSMAAPAAPTAAEWAFAAKYTLKNSKGYRYTWGQQVRSVMGTAFEGPDQGAVRFRVEIAPDGRLARLDTLWSTSPAAERLARQAISSMSQWPSTPTGRPLIFEKTISFSPFATDGPPLYKNDCLPDPPEFGNSFAWDGSAPREGAVGKAKAQAASHAATNLDPQALADCMKQLPQDSIEAESARDQRLMDQWDSSKRGG